MWFLTKKGICHMTKRKKKKIKITLNGEKLHPPQQDEENCSFSHYIVHTCSVPKQRSIVTPLKHPSRQYFKVAYTYIIGQEVFHRMKALKNFIHPITGQIIKKGEFSGVYHESLFLRKSKKSCSNSFLRKIDHKNPSYWISFYNYAVRDHINNNYMLIANGWLPETEMCIRIKL